MLVKKSHMITIFTAIAIFHLLFIKINYLYYQDYRQIKILSLSLAILLLLTKIKILVLKQWRIINLFVVLLALTIVYSSYTNRYFKSSDTVTSDLLAFGLIALFWLIEYSIQNKTTPILLKTIFMCSFIYCFITDILWIMYPSVYGEANSFLVGNKFDVSYLHFWMAISYLLYLKIKNLSKRKLYIALYVWAICVAIISECTTAVVGCVVFILLFCFRRQVEHVIRRALSVVIALIFFDSILIVNSAILSAPPINFFIVSVLGEDVGLTGRVGIYQKALATILGSPIWGYGYENNYTVSVNYIGAANIQNGILDCVMSYGIIGTLILLLIIIMLIRQNRESISYTIIAVLYVYIVISSVEIAFNGWFFACVAFLLLRKNDCFLSDDSININNKFEV